MRIVKRADSKMLVGGNKKRIRRLAIYGAILIVLFVITPIIFIIKDGIDPYSVYGLYGKLVFPVVVLLGVATALYREMSLIVIDKARGRLLVKRPVNRKMAGSYPLKAVSEVVLRHHGNPYYFPKLSIVLESGEEVLLNSDVLLATPQMPAVPLYDHVKREQALGKEVAAFIDVPFREIKGGEVTFGLDKADKEVHWAEDAESEK